MTVSNSATPPKPVDSARRVSRVRVVLTILGTLLVVIGELALLSGVYHRGVPTRQQRVDLAAYAGQLQQVRPGPSAAALASGTPAVIQTLRRDGVSAVRTEPIAAAARSVATNPAGPANLGELRVATTTLSRTLSAQQHRIDQQAVFSYAGLLIFASIGWMIWFKRLVGRHRELQRQWSEQQARAVGEQRLAALVRNSADVVAVCDLDSTISFISPSVHSMLGRDVAGVLGSRFADLVSADDQDLFVHLVAGLRPGDEQSFTLRMQHVDGRLLSVEGTLINLLADDAVNGLVMTVRDITTRVKLEERLTHQAFHDSLTGLANRQLFSDRLGHALKQRAGSASSHMVLICDLDDFKNINDGLGHGAGDVVLAEVGRRVADIVRSGDTAARFGGDEFAILMEATDLEGAQQVAHRLLASLAEPIIVESSALSVHASIGLAVAVPGQVSREDALRNADVAMYLAKDRGKSGVAMYEPQLHAAALERLELRADLQRALRQDELILHYQPTIDLKTGGIVGFEALVRWRHPSRGIIAPLMFIPMAEESGLIIPLGSWVLRTACRAAVAMQRDGRTPTMSVNVAAAQLAQPGFVELVLEILSDTGLATDRLCLEITESVVLKDLDTITARLTTLRELGIRIAIDDFGTGYSSLQYLSNLPVDVLKVDKSFVDKVTHGPQDASLTVAIIAMSHSMNLTTVAEGVEDAEQASWLTEANCTYGQGYLWSKPVPLERAHELLTTIALPRSVRERAPADPVRLPVAG
ncbi:MAG: hypothetical protein JWN95_2164 [Frankiales bacterium]|nr:hypothetical protein [Frankiales bacterium]